MRFKDKFTILYNLLVILLFTSLPAKAEPINIVAFGDSLMAGYQLPQGEAYPLKLADALTAKGYDIIMSNASVSGDTTSGGLSRLDWSIPDGTDAVILGLGANDALRGLPADITRKNIDKMIARLKERNIDVILMGMLAPPNMGSDYEAAFNPIYPEIAEKYQVNRYPFFLDGVAGVEALNIEDGIHPNPEGIALLVERTLPSVEDFLRSITD
ncbi:arylesterase [Lentilitoribacter sp. Alg239-R112]|jgi:acyl-CoA thioesterase-1|uniref:arylesterase n=1 Tax=Lentilitoribacter sp. Alg239-R112 TaxID=2305987 RepID=UPI0013A6FFDB|nr:arylesterase [Lentilitoribacter sp. Alg239-R112]